ncbi:tetratricopeptide repeat protein [Aureivirga sp. CE67]|uniref:tetratricopeptide repeat protein n=1 Tax=Aureivirga sp. CE67 TaxID=1788983 RepID=UPI0018CB042E|nr:tetratricopeptide repeat protein [Aureivirga sp. CE67]
MDKSQKFFKISFIIIIGSILVFYLGFGLHSFLSYEKNYKNQNFVLADEKDSEVWREHSVLLNKAGDFRKGFLSLNKAVELNPVENLGYRGWIRLRKLRDYDKALIDFNKLDSLTPNFVDAPNGEDIDFLRGECYFGKKNYDKAKEFFHKSIENQKEDWADIHSFIYLGLCEYYLENYEKAIDEFQNVLQQNKNVPEAYFGLAKVYYRLGEKEKAEENIHKAEETLEYKREDIYNEFLNEIYLSQILILKKKIEKLKI